MDGKVLRFHRAVIATGGRAAAGAIPGLEEAGYLTNETLFSLTELPRRLAVIGGGPIGSEMAQSFARFGAEVFLIEREAHILPREDTDAARRVEMALRRDGVHLNPASKVTRVTGEAGEKVVWIERDGRLEAIRADEILVGLGRAPNLAGLNLQAANVEYDARRGVEVNDRLQTTNRRTFAAGDVPRGTSSRTRPTPWRVSSFRTRSFSGEPGRALSRFPGRRIRIRKLSA